MNRDQADSCLKCTVFCLLLSVALIQATPSSYDLFQGSAYSNAGHRQRNKNWCARVVHKNVTCAVLDSTQSFVEPEVAPCPPHQPDCAQQVMYRTRFRPTYRVGYKMVTELEWRCCPGFQGPDCREPKGGAARQPVQRPRHQPQPIPGPFQHTLRPEGRETEPLDQRRGGDRVRQLEGEVQRLTQTVLDLQAAMTGMNENLRLDIQEDTSKMLLTLLNTLQLPDSALAGVTERVPLSGPSPGDEDVMARLDHVNDALKRKSDLLDEIQGTLNDHEGQLRQLMEASHGPAHRSAHGPSADSPAHSLDPVQAYVDNKLQELKEDLMKSMEDKMADLKSSCDSKIVSVQKQCEDQEASYLSLADLVDNKEAELRKEIRDLRLDLGVPDGLVRTNRGTAADEAPPDLADLRREIERVAEAHRVLNARLDNELEHLSMLQIEDVFGPRLDELEDRMNVTERNSEVHCFYVEEKLSRLIADEVAELRRLLDERMNTMEDQFTTMLVEINNSSFAGGNTDGLEALRNEMDSRKHLLQGLEEKLNALGKACSKDCGASPGGLENVLRDLRAYKDDLDAMHSDLSGSTDKLRELESLVQRQLLISQHNSKNLASVQMGLNSLKGKVGGLEGSVADLGESLRKQARDLESVNSTCGQVSEVCVAKAQSVQEALEGQLTPAAANSSQVEELRSRLEELSKEVRAELARRREGAEPGRGAGAGNVGGKLDNVSASLQSVAENLARQMASLGTHVQNLYGAQRVQARDVMGLRNSVENLQARLSGVPRNVPDTSAASPDRPVVRVTPIETKPPPQPAAPRPGVSVIRIPLIPHRTPPATAPRLPAPPQQPAVRQQPSIPSQPARPRRPVVETGEAGPPGVRASRGSPDATNPFTGFAGAPGHPSLTPVSFRPHVIPAAYIPHRPMSDSPLVTPVGGSVGSEPFSFSAGLTVAPLPWDMGVIRFNKVLVNDGGHYNPRSGVFTVPQDGRYLISAVLTAQRGDRVEAALSVSDRSVQRLTTAGYGRHTPGVAQAGPEGCNCGGSASFSAILSLKRGDRVKLVMTAGRLAASETREVLSTFSGIFLYSAPDSR
ncbi:hypothetical protein MATL_G00253530 [Megalops atlanticus]|uniref:Elastin microfibril interfacer 2 n=1 Tax=Megalops atlanticus TaxID=7932 RepID=A0A9D3PC14_MEGAT|nr:hypothetical protein MATL_G00253530 [Megalops atlanticus]